MKGWWGRWVNHPGSDSPTSGLAACQVLRGAVGPALGAELVGQGHFISEGPLKAQSLAGFPQASGGPEALCETHPLIAGATRGWAVSLKSEFLFLLLGHRAEPLPATPIRTQFLFAGQITK